jgi:intracellular multiplication protein IcmE
MAQTKKKKKPRQRAPKRWRVFMLAVSGLAIAVLFVSLFLGKKTNDSDRTTVKIKQAPRTLEGSTVGGVGTPEYNQMLDNINEQEAETALKSGRSSLPTPTGQGAIVTPIAQTPKPTSKPEERRSTQMTTSALRPASTTRRAETHDEYKEMLSELIESMRKDIKGNGRKVSHVVFQAKENVQEHEVPSHQTTEKQPHSDGTMNLNLKPGTAYYAVNLLTVNSDIQGSPVLAEIPTGPLKGSRFIGKFEHRDKLLLLSFQELVLEAGEVVPVQAYAIDPDTASTGLASDVDHHWLERYALPFIADLVSGVGHAVAQSGATTSSYMGTGGVSEVETHREYTAQDEAKIAAGKASERLSNQLMRNANRPVTVTLEQGQPIGIVIIDVKQKTGM